MSEDKEIDKSWNGLLKYSFILLASKSIPYTPHVLITFFVCYYGIYRPIDSLAGQVTISNIDVKSLYGFLFEVNGINEMLGYAVIILVVITIILLFIVYKCNSVKKEYVKKVGKLTKEHEIGSNPNRGTSGLTEFGDTNPEQ